MSKFTITKDTTRRVKRFNLCGRHTEFQINAPPNDAEPTTWIKSSIEEIVGQTMKELQPNDQVGITFCGESFKERGPGWVNFRPAFTVKVEDIWEMMLKIFQSNSQGLNTDKFCLGVTSVRLPQGRGNNRTRKYNTFEEECTMRKGIVTINNNDNLCLPRALVTAIANVNKDPDYRKIRRNIGKIQSQRAAELLAASNVQIPLEGAGIVELLQFQEYFKDYKIVVYQYGSKGRDILFEGANEGKQLNLLYHTGHYNVITSLTAAFCCSYYCNNCNIPYYKKNDHRCGKRCPCCQRSPACIKTKTEVSCKDCNRNFRGEQCYQNHLYSELLKNCICEQVKRCRDCLKVYNSDRSHTCGEIFCKICDKHVQQGHLCFIQPDNRKPLMKHTLYVFYDLETRQEKVLTQKKNKEISIGEVKLHEPNLCVFAKRCDLCIEEKSLYFCQKCGYRLQIYKTDVINNFMKNILEARKKFKKVVVIAHNGQAFDHQFILNYMLEKTDIKPELIMRGTKIIMMKLDNVKFIDSLNYFPMALSKLPKAFDLPPDYKKGYFPHLFNTTENENYVGLLPAIEYYSPDTMKTEEREVFLNWYNEHRNDEFNMLRDLVEYCVSDVQILTEACLKFRKLMIVECNVDPFIEATTIASACNLVFRRNFLKSNTIAIIPKNGYRNADNQSKIAIQWLIWEENKREINILHAAKQKEVVLHGVKVDGYCSETNQVFEFHGCYYHGHPTCLTFNRDSSLYDDPDDTLNRRYEATVAKTNRLRSYGHEVIEMWECDFRRQMEENEDIKQLKDHLLLCNTSLNPRDAFYGGRTGNIFKYYKCKPNEKIKYIDVCSLYPWVCKNGKFPIGHPKLYVGKENCSKVDLQKTEGLIKCKILPPEGLHHPVLPCKQNNKLMFTLCYACGEEKNNSEECPHTDNERALIGTWVVDEVTAALRKGYKILEMYEIWSYEIEQYDKLLQKGGLFTEMMNKFIKMKQQASGWPNKCITQEDKERYIEDFLENEGVKIEFSEITNNSGLRSLAKLILNSFWGKFGQRENQPKTCVINKATELYSLLTNPSLEVHHILPINENTVVVNWCYKEEACETLSTVNVCIAAYTTTQARLKLYSYLDQIGGRVLYYDTDSVIYVSREGEYDPPTGEFVGDMTDELECYGTGSYITEFVSGGPKNYAYQVFCTKDKSIKTVCKVKGICLNYETSKLVNFEVIKNMVLNSENNKDIEILSQNIRRTKDHEIVTVPEVKIYKPTSEKRRFLEDNNSQPYGFKRKRILCNL